MVGLVRHLGSESLVVLFGRVSSEEQPQNRFLSPRGPAHPFVFSPLGDLSHQPLDPIRGPRDVDIFERQPGERHRPVRTLLDVLSSQRTLDRIEIRRHLPERLNGLVDPRSQSRVGRLVRHSEPFDRIRQRVEHLLE